MRVTDKNLKIMGLLAAILLGLTCLLYLKPEGRTDSFAAGTLLVQGLEPDSIWSIAVKTTGQELNLTRDDGGFRVAQKNGYPADMQDINNLLIDLLDIRCAQRVAASAAAGEEYGISPETPEGGMIILGGSGDKELLRLLVGKTTPRGTFVSTGKEVFLSEKPFALTADPMSYIEQNLLRQESAKITGIKIKNGEDSYEFGKKDGSLVLLNPPAGKEEDTGKSWGAREALSRISIEDVQPVGQFSPEFSAQISLESGLGYVIEIAKVGDDSFLRAVAIEPAKDLVQKSMTIARDSSKEELAQKDAVLSALDTAKEFNALHANWRYKLRQWDAQRIMTPLADMLKDAPAVEPAPENSDDKATPAAPVAPAAPAESAVTEPKAGE